MPANFFAMSTNQTDTTSNQLQIRLPDSLRQSLRNRAKSQYRSESSVVREALATFLEGDNGGRA